MTPLHWACLGGNRETVELFFEFEETRGTLESTDDKDRLPLHIAAYKGHHAVCKRILELTPAGHALETDQDGNTPLILAVKRGNERAVQKLLGTEFGRCALHHEDNEGKTAEDVTRDAIAKHKAAAENAQDPKLQKEAEKQQETFEAILELVEAAQAAYEYDPTIEEMEENRAVTKASMKRMSSKEIAERSSKLSQRSSKMQASKNVPALMAPDPLPVDPPAADPLPMDKMP